MYEVNELQAVVFRDLMDHSVREVLVEEPHILAKDIPWIPVVAVDRLAVQRNLNHMLFLLVRARSSSRRQDLYLEGLLRPYRILQYSGHGKTRTDSRDLIRRVVAAHRGPSTARVNNLVP